MQPHSDASAAMFALLTASASRAVGFKSELAAVDAAHVAKVAALMRVAELAAERAAEDVAAIAAEAAQGKAIASQVALAADAQHCSDHSLAQAALSGLASDLKAATASGSAASAALVRSERSLASSRAESIRLVRPHGVVSPLLLGKPLPPPTHFWPCRRRRSRAINPSVLSGTRRCACPSRRRALHTACSVTRSAAATRRRALQTVSQRMRRRRMPHM